MNHDRVCLFNDGSWCWNYEYHFGKEPWFPAFLDYKKNRDSEQFRLNRGMEEFFEYVISLEERLK